MRRIIPVLIVLALGMAGCRVAGGSVGVGTGSGVSVSFSNNGDFLYSGNGEAYSNNRRGLRELLNKDYFAAREIFKGTLEKYPTNPDATYYLGLALIYEGERDAGYGLLLQYRDPYRTPIQQEVRWWAAYCRKKPELTPEKIHQVMNKARTEGYQRDREQRWERRRW